MKSGEVKGIVFVGTRASFSIEARSALWSSLETRVRNASWRSSEAVEGLVTDRVRIGGDTDLIFRTAS